MAKSLKVTVTVFAVPHPNPKVAIDLIAKIVTKQLANQDTTQLHSNTANA